MKKITIAIVDDHKLIRQMWAQMFADNNEIEIKGESETLDEAIEMIRINKPDIVFLDINLAQGSGLDAVPLIVNFHPVPESLPFQCTTSRPTPKKCCGLAPEPM